jgi:hypothetical protein
MQDQTNIETPEQYAQRVAQINELISQNTMPVSSEMVPENQVSRKQRRIQKAAFQREQKKLAKSLRNLPEWLR